MADAALTVDAPERPRLTLARLAARARERFFGTKLDAAITLLCLVALYFAVPPLANWAFIEANWTATAAQCREARQGACWAFIGEKFWFAVFGLYPYELRWRPATMLSLFAIMVGISLFRRFWSKTLVWAWVAASVVMFVLMDGTLFGLEIFGAHVPTRLWGGLTVTVFIAVFGLATGYPLAILLALGRRSHMPVVKWFCVALIECVRGVPLVTIIFMAAIMLPLFLPAGMTIDRLFRIQFAYTIFSAAYLAEVVRGGLQGLSRGQYEAAESLGLNYAQKMRLVILPQALKMTIPAQVNTFIGLFKDTTLVVIVGIFDFFTTLRAALGDPNWMGFPNEAYVFAAFVYFVLCFGMSKYSQRLERVLSPETRR
ncbi:MAG: amino acid ABC transporter permease [Tagaea sp.]|nr:amino acid ABC transporter permease [Azospirillum sp.]MCZ8124350.1 amino acid ABC transporter permease [Magnetospirillum sp.]